MTPSCKSPIALFYISAELSGLLKAPLIPVGFSGKYPTKTGALIMPGIRGKLALTIEKDLFKFISCQVAPYFKK